MLLHNCEHSTPLQSDWLICTYATDQGQGIILVRFKFINKYSNLVGHDYVDNDE